MSDCLKNFGYFSDARTTPARTWVLAIHHTFEGTDDLRKGNDKDVENLKNAFSRRNCLFKDLKSKKKDEILETLSNQEKLLQLFTEKEQRSQDDAPDVLFVFILSHGRIGGIIETDQKDATTGDFEAYYQKDVWGGLSGMTCLQQCLKVLCLGPCRGSNSELRLPGDAKTLSSTKGKNVEQPIWVSSVLCW
ncbi:uncharacterized protein LOC132193237 [Neocloeon triangulifer]|uniref:uncharacterized protein LOC132193237 n=1 Tax=Neocloeon triangulifer TaxID=2078957 RepID=UPI00286F1835|nr:uncharacterized protein LOC132193237 [Neocloeon triangulifer]